MTKPIPCNIIVGTEAFSPIPANIAQEEIIRKAAKMINEKIGEIERYLYNMYWIYIF